MSNVKHPSLPHMIAIAWMLPPSRYMFGICTVVGAPHARPGLPRWCGAPRTRVVCAYLFWQKQGQASTRRAAYPYVQSLRMKTWAGCTTPNFLHGTPNTTLKECVGYHTLISNLVCGRVLGLPIRDCAGGCTNCDHTRPQMSAIEVTIKILFERLYLVPGMGTFGP